MFPGCSRNPRLGRLSLFAFLTAAALSFGVALQVEKTLLAFLQKRFQLVLERGLGAHAGDAFFRGEGLFDGEVQLPALVQAQDLDLDLLLFLQVVPDVFDVRIGDFADMDQAASPSRSRPDAGVKGLWATVSGGGQSRPASPGPVAPGPASRCTEGYGAA